MVLISLRLSAVIALFTICLESNAQTSEVFPFSEEVIKIDTITRKPEKAIPFDKPFTLVIPVADASDIINIFSYKVEVYRNNGTTYRNICEKNQSDEDCNKNKLLKTKWRISGKQVLIDFPALPPNSHFDFCIVRSFSGVVFDDFIGFVNNIYKSKNSTLTEDKKVIEAKYTNFKMKIEPEKYITNRSSLGRDYLFKSNEISDTKRIVEEWYDASGIQQLYDNILGDSFIISLDQSDSASLSASSKLFKDNKIDNSLLTSILRIITDNKYTQFAKGLISLKYQYRGKINDPLEFKKRILNYDSTIANLNVLSASVEELYYSLGGNDDNLRAVAQLTKSLLTETTTARKLIADNLKSIVEKMNNDGGFAYTEWFINTSDFRDLQTKSGALFSPQIGMGVIRVQNNNGKAEHIPKLLVGININFKPVDKNLKTKYIQQKEPRHYISLLVALSLGKFDNSEYDNLYNGNSLLVGPSLRFSRSFFVSAGASFYKQQNSNPVINKKELAAGIYLAAMLDLDITQAISNFRSLIFK